MARTRCRIDANAGRWPRARAQVLLWTPRLRKSAKKLAKNLANTAAMFAAVGDVTLSCLVGVKVEIGAVAVGDRDGVLGAGVLELAHRADQPIERLFGAGAGRERTEADPSHRRAPPRDRTSPVIFALPLESKTPPRGRGSVVFTASMKSVCLSQSPNGPSSPVSRRTHRSSQPPGGRRR